VTTQLQLINIIIIIIIIGSPPPPRPWDSAYGGESNHSLRPPTSSL